MKNEGYICVFDCEAVPDAALIRRTLGFEGSDEAVSLRALEWQKEQSGSEFLPLPYHQIVSICAVIADSFGRFIKVNKIDGEDEAQMLRNFFAFVDKTQPKLVSFNGKNYDCPLLILRALKHKIRAQTYLDTTDKWNNYKTRFSELKHCDLLEVLGASGGRLRLDSLCAMVGLPGKYEICGDAVLGLFYQNKLEKIHEYCESDALNTYLLFLRYELIKGNLSDADYAQYLHRVREYLGEKKAHRAYKEVFIRVCEEEISKSSV